MSLVTTVLEDRGSFRGLQLEVTGARPSIRLEVAGYSRYRLSSSHGPLFWARSDNDHWARLASPEAAARVVKKISAADVRAIKGEPGSDRWWQAWAQLFARALKTSEDSPLYPATWWLEPVRGIQPARSWWDPAIPPPRAWQALLQDLGVHQAEPLQVNQLIGLRKPSAPDAARVKVWRKHARAGTLPPVLAWYLPGPLEIFVVLDGHDRIAAAAAERVAPRFLVLAHAALRHWNPISPQNVDAMMRGVQRAIDEARLVDVARTNAMVIDAHRGSGRHLALRSWPMRGGRPAWDLEVRAAAAALGVVPEIIGLLQAAP